VPEEQVDTLDVVAGGRRVRIPVADLDRGDQVRAVLDCTGGWYAEQDWAGVRLDRLLTDVAGVDLPSDGSVDVVSVTGFRRRLPLRDAGAVLLAVAAAGRPLSPGHGAPVRLVAPGRRGFWWVKWVRRIEVVDAPWWLQSPFPLQ
jgi:DMSO/TMAO reductase YedYZ molybdopterin-dependent catalytic subunit